GLLGQELQHVGGGVQFHRLGNGDRLHVHDLARALLEVFDAPAQVHGASSSGSSSSIASPAGHGAGGPVIVCSRASTRLAKSSSSSPSRPNFSRTAAAVTRQLAG